jgi:ubiquitin-protein ligase
MFNAMLLSTSRSRTPTSNPPMCPTTSAASARNKDPPRAFPGQTQGPTQHCSCSSQHQRYHLACSQHTTHLHLHLPAFRSSRPALDELLEAFLRPRKYQTSRAARSNGSLKQPALKRQQRDDCAAVRLFPPPSLHKLTRHRSLQKELMDLMLHPTPGISAFPSDENLSAWTATVDGPSGTPYATLIFKLTLEFPANYPYAPPAVEFKTPIYHPNVDFSGRICLDILKDKWSAVYNIGTVLLSLQSLLGEPNV